MAVNKQFPKSFGLLIYPEFEVLDMAGPIEILNCLILEDGAVGKSFAGSQLYLLTHTLKSAPHVDVLLVPKGPGSLNLNNNAMDDYILFIEDRYRGLSDRPLEYIISICNGAGLLAKSGILNGRNATTNKDYWEQVAAYGPRTQWVAKARWVIDGNIWTTSGVSTGADGVIAWMATMTSQKVVDNVVNGIEWLCARDADNDPFADIFGRHDIAPVQPA
nr:isonitrile hydratase [Quercus suber]